MGPGRGGPLTPAELSSALDALDRVVGGGGTGEELLLARASLPIIRCLLRDVRSGPDDVLVGRQAHVLSAKIPPWLIKLALMQPKDEDGRGALEGLSCWIERQMGTRGRRRLTPVEVVTDDGEWTHLFLPREPQVFRKAR